jgi:predicted small lipoprotein YifL
MRTRLSAFMVVGTLTFCITACGEKTPAQKTSDAGKSAGQATSDAAKATGKAVGDAAKATGTAIGDATKATGEFLSGSKDKAVKDAQEALDAIEKKWQDLQAKAAPATDEAKADLQKAKDEMAKALAEAKAKLVEAKDASADAWQKGVKPALDAAVQKTKKLYEDAAAKFSSK